MLGLLVGVVVEGLVKLKLLHIFAVLDGHVLGDVSLRVHHLLRLWSRGIWHCSRL